MFLNQDQVELLTGDLDYMLGRTACNTLQLTKSQVMNAIARDPDVLLDLVNGMSPEDARWLSVPIDILKILIARRSRGISSEGSAVEENLPINF